VRADGTKEILGLWARAERGRQILAARLFEILQPQIELVGIELLGALAKLHPLKLADEVAEAIVLPGELVARSDEPHLLGTLGVALDPRLHHYVAEYSDIIGKGLGGRTHDRD
jgi:hypothetical protein